MIGPHVPSLILVKRQGGVTPERSRTLALLALTGRRCAQLAARGLPCSCARFCKLVCPPAARDFHAAAMHSNNSCNLQEGTCIRGDNCPYAHNVFEYWLHPTRYTQLFLLCPADLAVVFAQSLCRVYQVACAQQYHVSQLVHCVLRMALMQHLEESLVYRYRTQLCNDGAKCRRHICFFAHSLEELRVPSCKPFVPPDALAAATTAAAADAARKTAAATSVWRLHPLTRNPAP